MVVFRSPKGGSTMPRRDQMDGLRALCFLAVFLVHLRGLFPQGYAGVYVFFALSGFLICGLLRRMPPGGLPAFYGRRMLRIVPAYYLFLALSAAAGQMDGGVAAVAYGLNLDIAIRRAWPPGAIGHLWTLAVEFQFYLLFPVAFLAVREGRRAWLVAGLIAGAKVARAAGFAAIPGPWAQFLTPACGEYLLWGCLFATLPRPRSERSAVACAALGLALLASWTWAMRSGGGLHGYRPSPWFTILGGTPDGLGSALLVYGLWWSQGRLARSLSWRPLAYLGKISYGLYLYHWPIIVAAYAARRSVPGLWRAPWAVAALASLAAAALSWHSFERPIMAWGRRRSEAGDDSKVGRHVGAPIRPGASR